MLPREYSGLKVGHTTMTVEKLLRLVFLLMIMERLQSLLRKINSVPTPAEMMQAALPLDPAIAMPSTAAYSNCTGHRSFVNDNRSYDGTLTISCHTFGYKAPVALMEAQKIHTVEGGKPFRLVVGVLSNNATMRQAIRATWGASLRQDRQLFFLIANQNFASIADEYERENDLLWLDMENDYYKLTYMTAAMLAIVHRYLPYTHVLKTDDDCYVHADRLAKHIYGLNESVHYHGHIPQLLAPIRDKNEVEAKYRKYILSPEVYPEPYFPVYGAGPGYVVTPTMNECVVREMSNIRYMPFEDVYVGMLAERCGFACHGSDLFVGDRESRWYYETHHTGRSDEILVQHHMADTQERMLAYHENPRKAFFQRSERTGASAVCGAAQPLNAQQQAAVDKFSYRTVLVSCRPFLYKAPIDILNQTTTDDLVYLVTATATFRQRQAIRETWAATVGNNHSVYFVVNSPHLQPYRQEFKEFRDMIWIQTKRDNPVYTVHAAMQAIQRHGRFRYLAMVHSQTFVFPNRFNAQVHGDFFGLCRQNSKAIEASERKDPSKRLTKALYPERFAPPKCAAAGYAMSASLVSCAATESEKVRFHPDEAISMGMLALRCGAWTTNAPHAFQKNGQLHKVSSEAIMIPNVMKKMMKGEGTNQKDSFLGGII